MGDRIVVIGAGVTGRSVVEHLLRNGEDPMWLDDRNDPPGAPDLLERHRGIRHRFGPGATRDLDGAQQIILSPGVDPAEPAIRQAANRGTEVIGDVELFARRVASPVIGITGSNGKTTVTQLLTAMARAAGVPVETGGNIGVPALDLLERSAPRFYVLELSSFQLETITSLRTHASVVLNIGRDHLDRHRTMSAYRTAKSRVYQNTRWALVNRDDPDAASLVDFDAAHYQQLSSFGTDAHSTAFGLHRDGATVWLSHGPRRLMPESVLPLSGRHNTCNVLAAMALAETMKIPEDKGIAAVRGFTGPAHRCQVVKRAHGITWINDSKGTNAAATAAALNGMAGEILLIAGGVAKDDDFSTLAAAAAGRVRRAFLIGRDATALAEALTPVCPVESSGTLDHAVADAARQARPGDTVLFSPACASFDQFQDFQERGHRFAARVEEVTP